MTESQVVWQSSFTLIGPSNFIRIPNHFVVLAVNAVVAFSFLYVGRIIESNLYVVRCTFVISLMNSDSHVY